MIYLLEYGVHLKLSYFALATICKCSLILIFVNGILNILFKKVNKKIAWLKMTSKNFYS